FVGSGCSARRTSRCPRGRAVPFSTLPVSRRLARLIGRQSLACRHTARPCKPGFSAAMNFCSIGAQLFNASPRTCVTHSEDSLSIRAAWLAYVGGYTQDQIAERLGISRVK